MAKITKDDLRTVHYLAQEFGIDRHSDVRLVRAFYCSVCRIALKDFRKQDAVDPHVADFDGKTYNIGGWFNGVVDQRIRSRQRATYYTIVNGPMIRHIVDWLHLAVTEQHPWIENVDALGRCKKLMKSGSIEALFDEAERQLARRYQRSVHATKSLTSDDLRWVCDLDHGLRLVQLLSPGALDDEGQRMKHCIGLGKYDRSLNDPAIAFYSVRDGDEKALATLEVEGSIVREFVGPENGSPREDVAVAVGNLMIRVAWMHWIEVYQQDVEAFGEYHRLCRLLGTPYHIGAMERFRLATGEQKTTDIARLRSAAGLGPDDPVPEPPVPAFGGIEDVTYEEIIIGEDGEPQMLAIDRETFLGGP
jgi:hypothetical protein